MRIYREVACLIVDEGVDPFRRIDQGRHVTSDRQGGGKARGLHAHEVHEARKPCGAFLLDGEVPGRRSRGLELGADARHVRGEFRRGHAGQVAADRLPKGLPALFVHRVIPRADRAVEVAAVRAEADPARQVQGGVDAQADVVLRRDGVNEAAQPRGRGCGEIIALAGLEVPVPACDVDPRQGCHTVRGQARAVDDGAGPDAVFAAVEGQVPGLAVEVQGRNLRSAGQESALGLSRSQEGGHEAVAVDDPCVGGQEGRPGRHVGFALTDLRPAQEGKAFHAVGRGPVPNPLQVRLLSRAGSHDELPDPPVGDVPVAAPGVQEAVPLHAQAAFEERPGVVDAGMEHLAVAGARFPAKGIVSLQEDQGTVLAGQRLCHGQAENTGPDDGHVESQDIGGASHEVFRGCGRCPWP